MFLRYSGWQCIEEYGEVSNHSSLTMTGAVSLPGRTYAYGNNLDEALTVNVRPDGRAHVSYDQVMGWKIQADGAHWEDNEFVPNPQEPSVKVYLKRPGSNAVAFTIAENTEDTLFLVENAQDYNGSDAYFIIDSPKTYFYHTDAQGNVVAISDATGRVIETVKYDVYGRLTEVKEWNGSALVAVSDANSNGFIDPSEYFAGSLTKNPRLFQSRDLDEETGLYYFRLRQYDPVHGRFLTRDPVGYMDSMCLYSFVNNSPVNLRDPMGMFIEATSEEYGNLGDAGRTKFADTMRWKYGGSWRFEGTRLVGQGWSANFNPALHDAVFGDARHSLKDVLTGSFSSGAGIASVGLACGLAMAGGEACLTGVLAPEGIALLVLAAGVATYEVVDHARMGAAVAELVETIARAVPKTPPVPTAPPAPEPRREPTNIGPDVMPNPPPEGRRVYYHYTDAAGMAGIKLTGLNVGSYLTTYRYSTGSEAQKKLILRSDRSYTHRLKFLLRPGIDVTNPPTPVLGGEGDEVISKVGGLRGEDEVITP